MNSKLTTIALLSLALAGRAQAETLDEAWAAALDSHSQIAAAAAERDAAGFEVERARSARLPRLGLNSAYTQLDTAPGFSLGGLTTGPIFDGDDFLSAAAQLSLPVYTGGAISAGIDAAESGARSAAEQLATVVQDIKLGAAERYVGVLRAESAVEVARSNVATLESQTEDTRNSYELGALPQNDYLASSVTLANAQQRLLAAENALDYARAAYNRFLGRPLTETVALDPEIDVDGLLPAGAGLAELIGIAKSERHELAALESQAHALRRQSDAARAGSRPQLALTGGYTYLENEFLTDDQFWMAGVALNWNLFDGGESRKRSAALDRRASSVSHRRADLETMIELQVQRAWNDRFEAENRLSVAERAVEQAIENLRVVRNRYAAGASTNVDVLDAEELREQAMSNRDNARFEVVLAKLRIARATGAL
jgi:outer membrane protein TolC